MQQIVNRSLHATRAVCGANVVSCPRTESNQPFRAVWSANRFVVTDRFAADCPVSFDWERTLSTPRTMYRLTAVSCARSVTDLSTRAVWGSPRVTIITGIFYSEFVTLWYSDYFCRPCRSTKFDTANGRREKNSTTTYSTFLVSIVFSNQCETLNLLLYPKPTMFGCVQNSVQFRRVYFPRRVHAFHAFPNAQHDVVLVF